MLLLLLLSIVLKLIVRVYVYVSCRKIFQQQAYLLFSVFLVLLVIIVFVVLINVVVHVKIIITIIVVVKLLYVLILFLSMCCLINRRRKNKPFVLHRYIRDIPSDRSDRTNGQPRTKEQSRSLPRIPLPVSVMFV